MRRAPVIDLSTEELTELHRTVRSSRSSVREVFRARIVLLAAEGQENRAIAEHLGTRPDTVSKWRRRFAEQRIAGLIDRPGRGRKPHFGREIIERIVDDTVHRTPEQATHWSTRTMARFFREITDQRIRRGIFRSVRELTQAIYDFLKHYNDNPRPFAWTKSADHILNKLAPLYANRG